MAIFMPKRAVEARTALGGDLTLRSSIHALTSDHLTSTPFGMATAPPLIRQLEVAIKGGRSGASANGNGKGDVINMTAMALYQEIAADIGIHTMEAGLPTSQDRVEMLKGWTALEDDVDWGDFLHHVALDWIDRIGALLSPLKPWHPSRPCPACEVEFYGDERVPPLSVHYLGPDGHQLHPHQWMMDCAACGAEWSGEVLGHVARAMSA